MEIGNQVHHFREGEEHDVTREFSRNKLHLQEEKGKGFFGTVFKAQAYGITMPGEWTTVAVKMIRGSIAKCVSSCYYVYLFTYN
jgi:hypothetical protein